MADCGCQEGLTLEALLARFSPPLEREVIQLVLEENKGENQMVLQTLEELCTAAECSLLIDGVVQDNPATIQLSQIATSVDARCLEFLESMFCDFEASTIEKVLREVNNNVENAVQELLSLSSLAEEGLLPSTSKSLPQLRKVEKQDFAAVEPQTELTFQQKLKYLTDLFPLVSRTEQALQSFRYSFLGRHFSGPHS